MKDQTADVGMRVSCAVTSDRGLLRSSNEDSECARPDIGLFLVADGMGGHVAGEVASRLVVKTIEKFIQETKTTRMEDNWPFPFNDQISVTANRAQFAFRLANRALASKVAGAEHLHGMGTTASAIVINDRLAAIAHVGDSRIYRLRGGQFKQLTTDHSWVQEQVQAGELTPSAARQHPRRNIVTRSLSGGEDPDVDLDEYELEIGDRFLICSDGLFAVVSDERIKELLSQSVTLETVCNNLVETANAGGGPDNITTLVLQIDDP